MKEVASLRYGVIFKKAFSDPKIFTAFVEDLLDTKIEINAVETEKSFKPAIENVNVKFDLFAEDLKNRIVVDIQHERHSDHYDRFLHYQMVAILEQIAKAENYRPALAVYTIVVLTSGDRHGKDIVITDFDPRDLEGDQIGEIPHKILYLCPKYVNDKTPEPLREWLLAIEDSLDEEVNESNYSHPEIHRVFDIIKRDKVTPEERAEMIEENHEEELKQQSFNQGVEQTIRDIVTNMRAQNFDLETIASVTKLSMTQVQNLLDGDDLESL